MPTLAGISEVAKILGVPVRNAYRLVNRKDFPKPIDTLATGRVWERRAVREWKKRAPVPLDRKRGRPPKT